MLFLNTWHSPSTLDALLDSIISSKIISQSALPFLMALSSISFKIFSCNFFSLSGASLYTSLILTARKVMLALRSEYQHCDPFSWFFSLRWVSSKKMTQLETLMEGVMISLMNFYWKRYMLRQSVNLSVWMRRAVSSLCSLQTSINLVLRYSCSRTKIAGVTQAGIVTFYKQELRYILHAASLIFLKFNHEQILLDFEGVSLDDKPNTCVQINLLAVYIQIKYYKQCRSYCQLMQFGQLQEIEEECLQVEQGLRSARQEEVESVKGKVRKRRVEIEEMNVEVLGLKSEVKKKRQLEKKMEDVRTEIEKVKSFAVKQREQSKRLQDLVEQTEYKSKMQQKRIAEIQAQQAILQEFQASLQSTVDYSRQYDFLKQKLNVLSTQLLTQKMSNNLQLQRRKQQLKALQLNNISIDQQIANLQQQIARQHQTISQIKAAEQRRLNEENHKFEILNKQEKAFFKKEQELDIWEKHELRGLLQKRDIQKQKERRIGSIWKQRLSTHSHKERSFVNRSFTYSQNQSPLQKESSDLIFISSERMKELQKNKRIRTRYTEPRVLQQVQASPIPNKQTRKAQQPESRPSILTLYEQFKKQRMPSQNSIKLLRSNKKRSINQQKGVPTQLQQFD